MSISLYLPTSCQCLSSDNGQTLNVIIPYRKERMEAEMRQLEKDIETVEKHKIIYVTDNF